MRLEQELEPQPGQRQIDRQGQRERTELIDRRTERKNCQKEMTEDVREEAKTMCPSTHSIHSFI